MLKLNIVKTVKPFSHDHEYQNRWGYDQWQTKLKARSRNKQRTHTSFYSIKQHGKCYSPNSDKKRGDWGTFWIGVSALFALVPEPWLLLSLLLAAASVAIMVNGKRHTKEKKSSTTFYGEQYWKFRQVLIILMTSWELERRSREGI